MQIKNTTTHNTATVDVVLVLCGQLNVLDP